AFLFQAILFAPRICGATANARTEECSKASHAKPPGRLVHKRELLSLPISGDKGAWEPEPGRGDIGKQCRIVIVPAPTMTSLTNKRTIFCRSLTSIVSALASRRH